MFKVMTISLLLCVAGCAASGTYCRESTVSDCPGQSPPDTVCASYHKVTFCLPCSQAKSPEARFVCFGVKP